MALSAIFGCGGPVLNPEERAFFAESQPWGFILFARNVEAPDQLARLTDDLRRSVGRDAPILIDQEGGRVARLAAPHWRTWAPPLDQMQAVADRDTAIRALGLRYGIIAHELRAVGIDVNCTPLADLAQPDTHPILRNRLYGADPGTVVAAGRAVADALLSGGVLPVLKHVPGHGRATQDSHLNLPRVATPRATLEAEDFAAFRGLADVPLAMTAHIVFDTIDPDHAGTVSPTIIRLIREEIGVQGLLMTDDISMQALSGTIAERGQAALAAGCDLVLHCNGNAAEMESLAATLAPLTPATEARAAAALAQRGMPDAVDIAGLETELQGLLRGGA